MCCMLYCMLQTLNICVYLQILLNRIAALALGSL
jgi:hypothetical protein